MSMQSKKMAIWSYLQPVLLALAPLSVFISENVDKIKPAWIVRPFLLITLIALSLAFVCQRIFRNPQLGMLTASLIALLVLQSGQLLVEIGEFLSRLGPTPGALWFEQERQQQIYGLALAIQVILLLMLSWALNQRPRYVEKLAVVLNIIALTVLVSSSIGIVGKMLGSREITTGPTGISAEDLNSLSPSDPLPDIYYIILDSYPSKESLQEEFDFDNSSFLTFLEDRGFAINNDSLSNYYRSAYSMASTLNMDYIHDIAIRSDVGRLDGFNLSQSVRQSAIRRILSGFGYQTVAFSSGFYFTDMYDADVYYPEDSSGMNPLEATMLTRTLYAYLFPFLDNDSHSLFAPTYTSHINTIANTLDTLGTLGAADVPVFVVAHVLSPHPPFVYDRDGEITIPPRPFDLHDAGGFLGSLEEYREGFANQTAFLNERIKGIIDSILTTSPRPSIIILQGDHGTRWKCDMDSATCEDIRIAYSILNARYLPGVEITENEAALSPVNTFRMILNAYFGGQISYLPDSSFISVGDWLITESMEPVEFPERY